MADQYRAISLFSGAAIGDIGFRVAGYSFFIMSEIDAQRAELARINFPEAKFFVGDINSHASDIIQHVKNVCLRNGEEPFLINCTAPCQGMSKSGQGTLLKNIRLDKRPKMDPRNRLILPALDIIKETRPQFVVFENVCEMRNMIIEDKKGNLRLILDIIHDCLSHEYEGEAYDVEFADYGIPQRRKRLITVYTRNRNAIQHYLKGTPLIPESTHSIDGTDNHKRWIWVREVLSKFPSLDAESKQSASHPSIPFHRVPILDPKKYEWVKHTPLKSSAFDNQCMNPNCKFQENRIHGSRKNIEGINQSIKDTPLYCEKCGWLLPRPYTENEDGSLRIMSGYTSAYKRMDPDLPCPTLTRNLSFPCSDHKIHPFENRVLSLAEAFSVHTLDRYEYKWGPILDSKSRIKEVASDSLIRLVIGESIPPLFMEILGRHLKTLLSAQSDLKLRANQHRLF